MRPDALLAELVRIRSVTGEEAEILEFIARFCRTHGLPCEADDAGVTVPLAHGAPCALIFNAHVDTVGAGDAGRWHSPPFGEGAGAVVDGRLYGLGASDDKAGVAALLCLAASLGGEPLPLDVYFTFVAREETDGTGTRAFLSHFCAEADPTQPWLRYVPHYREKAAVIAEPTNLCSTEIGHRGSAFLRLTVSGDSGHASQPDRVRRQALRMMLEVIGRMDALATRLRADYRHETLGEPTFCLTGIQAPSDSPNKIPGSCTSTWDVRVTPALEDKLAGMLAEELAGWAEIEYLKPMSTCGMTSPDSPIVQALRHVVPGLAVVPSPASNDICFFTRAGIPAVTFGPGTKEAEHQENEWAPVSSLDRSIRIYRDLITTFARTADAGSDLPPGG